MPTLDLHGYRKENAIRALVTFLEQHRPGGQVRTKAIANTTNCRTTVSPRTRTNDKKSEGTTMKNTGASATVQVITGVGKHSARGPILRDAVKAYLQRHHYIYQWFQGYFLIQSGTGQFTYQRQISDEDTKLILTDQAEVQQYRIQRTRISTLRTRIKAPMSDHSAREASDTTSRGTKVHTENNSSHDQPTENLLSLSFGPSIRQMVQEEVLMKRGKEESIQEFKQEQQLVLEEQRTLASVQEISHKQHIQEIQQHDEMLQQVILESEQEQYRLELEEEEMIQRAIQAENDMLLLQQQNEDEILQQVLELSAQDWPCNYDKNDNDTNDQIDSKEDLLLLQALELSKQQQDHFLEDTNHDEDTDYDFYNDRTNNNKMQQTNWNEPMEPTVLLLNEVCTMINGSAKTSVDSIVVEESISSFQSSYNDDDDYYCNVSK